MMETLDLGLKNNMKFICLTAVQKAKQSEVWKPWFAWYPVKVGDKDCRWLEWVERMPSYYYFKHYPGYNPLFIGYKYRTKD